MIVLPAAVLAAAPSAAMVVPGPPAAAGEWYAAVPRVNAWGAGLVDAGTGVQLWGKDVNIARPMGSITPAEHSTYSTPADLIRLGELAMRNPLFRSIVAQRRYRVAATTWHHRYLWQTTNALLGSYRGALGIKTGDTNAAGNCFLFEARYGQRTLIGVVLHVNPTSSPNALFNAVRRLLTWGFQRI